MEEEKRVYSEELERLSFDFGVLDINNAVKTYNELKSKDFLYNEEKELLAESNNKIVIWNSRVKNLIDIYNSLINRGVDMIPSPQKYYIRGFYE